MAVEESKGIGHQIRRLILWVGLPLVALMVLFMVVSRFQARPVVNAVRTFNKHVFNPTMMRLAGRRHWYASAIRHKGRRSRKEYATPVMAEPIEEGFIVPLPYGTKVDWLKNVLAARGATIEAKGESHTVVEPEVIDAVTAFPLLPPRLRRTWGLFGIERYLKVKRLSESSLAEAAL